MIYVSFFNVLVALRFMFTRKQRTRDHLYPWLLLALFLFTAFRFEVGCDWNGYFLQFVNERWLILDELKSFRDPGWWALIEAVYDAGLPYPILNVVSAVIFYSGVHLLARRQQDPFSYLTLLFPFLIVNIAMSALRQAIAVGFLCAAFSAFISRRMFWFAILTLLATLFHSSAILFMLLLPLAQGRFSRGRIVASAVLAIPGLIFLASGDDAQLAIQRYVGTTSDAVGGIFRVALLTTVGTYFLTKCAKRWRESSPSDYPLVVVGSLLMIALLPITLISSVIGDRLGYYLIPIQVMILARLPYLFGGRSFVKTTVAPYGVFALTFLVWTMTSWHFRLCYIPYDSWLFGFPYEPGLISR